jgi:hypothetical protein
MQTVNTVRQLNELTKNVRETGEEVIARTSYALKVDLSLSNRPRAFEEVKVGTMVDADPIQDAARHPLDLGGQGRIGHHGNSQSVPFGIP